MFTRLEVLLTPAEFALLPHRDLTRTACVVLDVLRATSTMLEALNNGAEAIWPVAGIPAALDWRRRHPEVLLAGEREGLRIGAALTGGVEFDLGNSPGEFTRERVAGRSIVMTTSNGTRALDAGRGAGAVLASSFGNLAATVAWLQRSGLPELAIVCAGTLEHCALEDVLGAGALVERLWTLASAGWVDDAAWIVLETYRARRNDLSEAAGSGRNGRRLLSLPDLADDVPRCLIPDRFPFVALRGPDGALRREAVLPAN